MTAMGRDLDKAWLCDIAEPLADLLIKEMGPFITASPDCELVVAALVKACAVGADSHTRCALKAAFMFGSALARYDAGSQYVRSGVVMSSGVTDPSATLAEVVRGVPAELSLDEDVLLDVVA